MAMEATMEESKAVNSGVACLILLHSICSEHASDLLNSCTPGSPQEPCDAESSFSESLRWSNKATA